VLEYYKGSLTKALLDMFPNIGLDPSKFGTGIDLFFLFFFIFFIFFILFFVLEDIF